MDNILIGLGIIYAILIFVVIHKIWTIWYFSIRGVSFMLVACLFGGMGLAALTYWLLGQVIGFAVGLLSKLVVLILQLFRIVVLLAFVVLIIFVIYCRRKHINPLVLSDEEYNFIFDESETENETALEKKSTLGFGNLINRVRKAPLLWCVVAAAIILFTFWFAVLFFEGLGSSSNNHEAPAASSFVYESETPNQLEIQDNMQNEDFLEAEPEEEIDYIITLNANEGTFDSFCGLWETADGSVQFTISADESEYCISAHIVPWEMTTEQVGLSDGEHEAPWGIIFPNNASIISASGLLQISPNMENGTIQAAYDFERNFADPSKTSISGEWQDCIQLTTEIPTSKADYTQCLGLWIAENDQRVYYDFQKAEIENQIILSIYTEREQLLGGYGLRIPVEENAPYGQSISGQFELDNGIYGEVRFSIDRFNNFMLDSVLIYGNNGAVLVIQSQNQKLIRPSSDDVEYGYGMFLQALYQAMSTGDIEEEFLVYSVSLDPEVKKQIEDCMWEFDPAQYSLRADDYEILDAKWIDLKTYEMTVRENIVVYDNINDTETPMRCTKKYTLEKNQYDLWVVTNMVTYPVGTAPM